MSITASCRTEQEHRGTHRSAGFVFLARHCRTIVCHNHPSDEHLQRTLFHSRSEGEEHLEKKRRKEDVLESPKQQKAHLVFVFPSTEHHFVFPRKQCAPSAAYTHCRPLSQFFSCSLPILSAEFRSFLQQQCRFGAIGGKSRSNSIILWSTRAPGSLPELMSPQLSSVARHFP